MATSRQIAANKANSQKSTGPKTPEGKAASSRNHFSHGFASATAKLLPGEDSGEFDALLAGLIAEYRPATLTEQILVEKMGLNQWLSLRAFRLQGRALCDPLYGTLHASIPAGLGLLIRYQTAADRAFLTARCELLRLQKERKKSEIGFESQAPVQPVGPPPLQADAQTEAGAKMAPPPFLQTDFTPPPFTPPPCHAEEVDEILNEVGRYLRTVA